ncbi:MAG: hypothetical protein IPI57_12845 [Candidatus Competibacteraceae bacterium]|nr:hypothetical protein [Candidatus Competibacteraceae bacterium]
MFATRGSPKTATWPAACHPLSGKRRRRHPFRQNRRQRDPGAQFADDFQCRLHPPPANWDGVADTLEAHADRLLLNPESACAPTGRSCWPGSRTMLSTFAPSPPLPQEAVSPINVLSALASYETLLVTPDARFDRYLRGEANALTVAERQGYPRCLPATAASLAIKTSTSAAICQKFRVFERTP